MSAQLGWLWILMKQKYFPDLYVMFLDASSTFKRLTHHLYNKSYKIFGIIDFAAVPRQQINRNWNIIDQFSERPV